MSDTVYHVDRGDELAAGETVSLRHAEGLVPGEHAAVGEIYPEGLSPHGRYYCTQDLYGEDPDDLWDFACEAIFEVVRLARFPDRPSRLQSAFGFETLDETEAFVESHVEGPYTIWEVVAEDAFKGDMRLVDAEDFADGLYRADYYWRGETFREDPLWELLLVPPVEVKTAVDLPSNR